MPGGRDSVRMSSDGLRLASWNVNSIRSHHLRLGAWIERHRPDVLALQETKCTGAVFAEIMAATLPAGYDFVHHGRNHWNGVAIVSRVGIDDVRRGLPGFNRPPYDEARLISARCGDIDVHSLYAPNGRELDDPHYLFKLVWFERLRTARVDGRPTAMLGDFNVAPADADIYDPKRWRRRTHASPPERAAINALLDTGLRDITREHLDGPGVFTWWSYRPGQFEQNRGLRIDLALCDDTIADRVQSVWIDVDERRDDHPDEKPSDHAPLVVDLD
jgi:exodeoxyribonuclease-3